MTTPVVHLNFSGNAREALDFYATAFGGTAVTRAYSEFGMPADLPGADNVVWGAVTTPNGLTLMAYDIPATPTLPASSTHREGGVTITNQSFFLSVTSGTLEQAKERWESLADGATVVEPLAASAWSQGFGMLTDRFGVTWIIDAA